MKQRCRFCRCTEEDSCPAGCCWIEVDLCSVCADFLLRLEGYDLICRQVTKASLSRMLDEARSPFLKGEAASTSKAERTFIPGGPLGVKAK